MTMQTTHPNWWPTDNRPNPMNLSSTCTSCSYLPHWMPVCWETSNQQLGWWLIIVWMADVTHRHFHHPTFLRRKVSLKHHRLRSFRETIIPLWKSAGNRRNWWHHGCQSRPLWFVSRKAICCCCSVCYLHDIRKISVCESVSHDKTATGSYAVPKCSFLEMHLYTTCK